MPSARSDCKPRLSGIDRLCLGPSFVVRLVKIDWRLSEALAIQKRHGDDAPRWIAERLGALALAGDVEGVERFKAIAVRLNDLMVARRQ